MKNRWIIRTLVLVSFCVSISCVREYPIRGGNTPIVSDNQVRLAIFTNSEAYSEPDTRTGTADETALAKTPWILVFEDKGGVAQKEQKFVEAKQAVIIGDKAYVSLTKTTESEPAERRRQLLVVANTTQFRNAGGTLLEMSEENLQTLLENQTLGFAVANLITPLRLAEPPELQTYVPYTALPTNPTVPAPQPIPLSAIYPLPGGIDATTVIGTVSNPLQLSRVVARVTVCLPSTQAAETVGFTLDAATVVGVPREGTLAPAVDGLQNNSGAGMLTDYLTTTMGDGVTEIAAAATVDGNRTTEPNPLYLYESRKEENSSVIVKGNYKGAEGYYRLTFRDASEQPIDILRNNHYIFTIRSVSAAGYGTVEEAIGNAPSTVIDYDIRVADTDSYDMIDNGQYYLGVTNSEYVIYADENKTGLLAFTVTTNAPTSVLSREIIVSGGAGLAVTTVPTSSPAQVNVTGGVATTEVRVDVNAAFAVGTERLITVRVGSLVKRVKVRRQTNLRAQPQMWEVGPASSAMTAAYVSGKIEQGGEWLALSTVNDPLQASGEVTRADGPGNLYIAVKSNVKPSGAEVRRAGELYLCREGEEGRVKLHIDQSAMNLSEVPETPIQVASGAAYVGTFHRHNQMGERLIRLDRNTIGNSLDGEWEAMVVAGEEWIRLDTKMTTDVNYAYYNHVVGSGANEPDDMSIHDAVHRLSDDANLSVNGVCAASGAGTLPNIFFRVGLTSTIGEDEVRYGLILVTYANHTKVHKIYVRQGDAADYLMRPDETGTPGSTLDSRPNAKKIIPYNLTLPADKSYNTTGYYTLDNRGATFTQYPTQTGCFFQWNCLMAWVPVGSIVWSHHENNGTWNTNLEPCPSNIKGKSYRHPDDGGIFSPSGAVTASEPRQSYFLKPPTGNVEEFSNSLWGYYADGFFDRRKIKSSENGALNATVSDGREIAYIGRLYFHPVTYAALFFPATGVRNNANDMLSAGVASIYYSSSTSVNTTQIRAAWTTVISRTVSRQSSSYKTGQFPIRCVEE